MTIYRSRSTTLVVSLVATLLLAACGAEDEVAPAIQAPPVLAVNVEARDMIDRIEATGQLLAKAEASVAAQVRGQVAHVAVEESAAVVAGQVVVQIDPEQRSLELANQRTRVVEAQAQLELVQREYRRIAKLHAQNAASQSQLESSKTEVDLATSRLAGSKAEVGLAERAFRDATVTAPFAGLFARRYVIVGEFVSQGQPLFDLVALDPIEVEFHLPERDSSRVSLGALVEVRVSPFPDEIFYATVTVISPTIDAATRTLRVKAEAPNPQGRLRPGLFARAHLGVAERQDVIMIPEDAVLQRSDGAVVFRLVADSRVERVRIRTGVYRDGFVEVAEGLSPGDSVVVRGQTSLIDGSVVSLRNQDGSPVTSPSPHGNDSVQRLGVQPTRLEESHGAGG
jgi:membrane fusion protein (multidrug efflux system)